MPFLVSISLSRLSCPDAIIMLMFLVNSLIKFSIFWALLEFTILDEKSESAKNEIMKSEATLEKKKKEICKCQVNLQNIKQQATNPQTSVNLNQIEAAITKNELFVQSLIDDEKVYKLIFQFMKVDIDVMLDLSEFYFNAFLGFN
jgi:hypothetical protein